MDTVLSSLAVVTAVLDWEVLHLLSSVEAAVARMADNNMVSSTAVVVTEAADTVVVAWASWGLWQAAS